VVYGLWNITEEKLRNSRATQIHKVHQKRKNSVLDTTVTLANSYFALLFWLFTHHKSVMNQLHVKGSEREQFCYCFYFFYQKNVLFQMEKLLHLLLWRDNCTNNWKIVKRTPAYYHRFPFKVVQRVFIADHSKQTTLIADHVHSIDHVNERPR